MNIYRPRILAIDDVPANMHILGAAMHEEFELQIASSGAIGLSLAESSPPDLILLDVMMPQMDGYETLRRLKANPALRMIPVIFITALSDIDSENAGLKMGVADYITKPIKIEITLNRIRNILEREQLRREVEAHRDQLEDQVRIRTSALSAALEMAEINNRAKNRFLVNMSHEFRTPLNGILGVSDLMLYRSTDPTLKDLLAKVSISSENLLTIINNVLDLSRLEAEKLILLPVSFKLSTLFDSMTRLFGKAAQDKGLKFTIESTVCDQFVEADFERLVQVLQNMVGNAIKFSDTGQVSILSSPLDESEADLLVRFEVQDSGIGISLEDQKCLFNAFDQADNSTTRQYGGAGVGLAISKHLAALLGGEIGVESQAGRGSSFWFTARLKKTIQAEMVSLPSSAKECVKQNYPGARILLVEADPLYKVIMTVILEDNGFVVDVVRDSDSAMAMASTATYLAMIIDEKLMALNDPQIVGLIRGLSGCEQLAVLTITDDETDVYHQGGITDIVSIMPLDQEKFFTALNRCLLTKLNPSL